MAYPALAPTIGPTSPGSRVCFCLICLFALSMHHLKFKTTALEYHHTNVVPQLKVRPKKNNCLVVLHNFFWEGAGRHFFFLKSKSKLHGIIASISLNKGASKSTKKYLYTSLKAVLKCTQVENNNLKNIFKRSNFSKKKKTFFGIVKIRGGILLYSKNFFPVFKN